jgi:hypothetical protein
VVGACCSAVIQLAVSDSLTDNKELPVVTVESSATPKAPTGGGQRSEFRTGTGSRIEVEGTLGFLASSNLSFSLDLNSPKSAVRRRLARSQLESTSLGHSPLKSSRWVSVSLCDKILGMKYFLSIVGDSFSRAAGQVLGVLLVLLILVALTIPVYLIMKRRTGRTSTFALDMVETLVSKPTPVSQLPPESRQMLSRLRTAEVVTATFYEYLLGVLMVLATGLMAYIYLNLPNDGNRALELAYIGILYAIGMLWMASQLRSARRRRFQSTDDAPSPPNSVSPARSPISMTIRSSPQVQFIDNQGLDRAQNCLDSGGSLDEACGLVDPKYRSMNNVMQKLFQKAVEAALQQRRTPSP